MGVMRWATPAVVIDSVVVAANLEILLVVMEMVFLVDNGTCGRIPVMNSLVSPVLHCLRSPHSSPLLIPFALALPFSFSSLAPTLILFRLCL